MSLALSGYKFKFSILVALSSGRLLVLDARQPRRRLVRLAALPLRRHRTTQTRLEQRRAALDRRPERARRVLYPQSPAAGPQQREEHRDR